MSYPEGCYVYVYLDGCDPIYVGAGRGGRAWTHLYPSAQRYSDSNFYPHLQGMLASGDRPIIAIVKEGLTAEEARDSEAALIELLGTRRAGTGTLLNVVNPLRGDWGSEVVMCWGEGFYSLAAVARDPRCVVHLSTLQHRVGNGVGAEEAAETPAMPLKKRKYVELTCWGVTYRGWKAFSRDPRCVVSGATLMRRMTQLGWTIERAAATPVTTKKRLLRPAAPGAVNPN